MHDLLPGLIAVLGLIGLASIVAPRVVLSVFLPPLLYSEAWRASWHGFRRWLRDAGKINDGDHQKPHLELDREHTDLHPAGQV